MRCKLTLENRTDWNSRDLRRLIVETMKQAGYDGRAYQKVIVSHSKRHSRMKYNGVASSYSNQVWMRVPKHDGHDKPFNTVKFTQQLKHELDHNVKLNHEDMIHWWNIEVPWAKSFTVNPKASPQPKPKRDLVMERYEHSKKMSLMHQKKLSREKNIVKKWQRKVRYYEKKITERQKENELCRKE